MLINCNSIDPTSIPSSTLSLLGIWLIVDPQASLPSATLRAPPANCRKRLLPSIAVEMTQSSQPTSINISIDTAEPQPRLCRLQSSGHPLDGSSQGHCSATLSLIAASVLISRPPPAKDPLPQPPPPPLSSFTYFLWNPPPTVSPSIHKPPAGIDRPPSPSAHQHPLGQNRPSRLLRLAWHSFARLQPAQVRTSFRSGQS